MWCEHNFTIKPTRRQLLTFPRLKGLWFCERTLCFFFFKEITKITRVTDCLNLILFFFFETFHLSEDNQNGHPINNLLENHK